MENHKIICQEKCTLGLILNSEEKMHTQICLKLGFGSSIWLGFMGRITFNGWVILIFLYLYLYLYFIFIKMSNFKFKKLQLDPCHYNYNFKKLGMAPWHYKLEV